MSAGEYLNPVQPPGLKDEQTVDDQGRELFSGVAGAEVVRLSPHADGRGWLIPFLDLGNPFWKDEPPVYAYAIMARPGVIKGWGMHRHQADRYFVSPGRLRVVLYDGREDSPTFQKYQQIWFSDETAGLVRIPAGVWHADQNWGDRDVTLINFPTRAYDPDDPDKFRLDPHGGEIPFDWTVRDG
jgi:dTDP-4-dehydrorhamnose 3,5-epimerase